MLRQINTAKSSPNVLVGSSTNDDAGVYQLTDEIALIQSVDYFTPIVDDPYWFGQIAAANALSDIYAMGGIVKTGLNIVGYPIKKLGPDMLGKILQGAYDKMTEAGGDIIGGHSIDDQEPKFGMAVTGIAHPKKIFQNSTAKQGDAILLTKPVGVGIQTTAIKKELLQPEQIQIVTNVMAQLNKTASEMLHNYHTHAVTDVTGFGLLGHAYEMAAGSKVSMNIRYSDVPILKETENLAESGVVPGGTKSNHAWLYDKVSYKKSITSVQQLILCDAITSGGLLVAMPYGEAEDFLKNFQMRSDFEASIIGEVIEQNDKSIYVS
ncbi:selenide,water dikinase [Thalassobacillus pellis]|nr:selenide,water dikinase [Thalassobacillus pellis]